MANPVRIRVRGDEDLRRSFDHAKAEFQCVDTQEELIKRMSEFVLENEDEFRRFVADPRGGARRRGHRR